MTSNAFVWRWHPGAADPVLCGRLFIESGVMHFVYGQSYRRRHDAIALSPYMPVDSIVHRMRLVSDIPRPLADAAPDNWGRRVIEYRAPATKRTELDYLLSGGGDRIGAFEFTATTTPPPPPASATTYEELRTAAETLERDHPLSPEMEEALQHGTSIGGARPKATAVDGDRSLIVKLSSTTDRQPIVRLEAAGLTLASMCGIDTPWIDVISVDGKDALLVERFDRRHNGIYLERRQILTALSLLNLDESEHRAATYPALAEVLRRWGSVAEAQQLYRRMIFNILVGNTDDHAKNHSAFWNGRLLELTKAYDIVPLPRFNQEANQAMGVGREGALSSLRNARSQSVMFGLTAAEAEQIEDELVAQIRENWMQVFADLDIPQRVIDHCHGTTVLSPASMR